VIREIVLCYAIVIGARAHVSRPLLATRDVSAGMDVTELSNSTETIVHDVAWTRFVAVLPLDDNVGGVQCASVCILEQV
jgi:hypothetical protein